MSFMHPLMILAGTVSGFEFVSRSALLRQQQVSRSALDSTNSRWVVEIGEIPRVVEKIPKRDFR